MHAIVTVIMHDGAVSFRTTRSITWRLAVMLRVASNALIVSPFEAAWLALPDHGLDGACCLAFECRGANDVTIILRPFPGGKRWQHLQRRAPGGDDAAGGGGDLTVGENYTIILGSHRNSKLKIEKNGEEKASATGVPGCTVSGASFTPVWLNYEAGRISVGVGAPGSELSFVWADEGTPVQRITAVGLSCWDSHVSYRGVTLLPPLPAAQLDALVAARAAPVAAPAAAPALLQPMLQDVVAKGQQAQQQQDFLLPTPSGVASAAASCLPSLLGLVMAAIVDSLTPHCLFAVLHVAELLLPRSQPLYDACVQRAGVWLPQLAAQQLQELVALPLDVLADVLQEPLVNVPELTVFDVVAAWCQGSTAVLPLEQQQHHVGEPACGVEGAAAEARTSPSDSSTAIARCEDEVLEALQLVRFAYLSEAEQQVLLARPFACTCPLVQRCLSNELMQLEEGAAATPSSPREKLTCQQRVLLLSPRSAVAADGAAAASARPLRAAMLHAGPGSQRRGAVAAAADSDRPRRYRRRLAPSCKELMYVSDGDANGVLYHLGTAYGSMSWVNPVASRAVRIVASSPASRFTDAKALASRQFLRTSFAGPRYVRAPLDAGSCSGSSPDNSSGDCCTWWLLDLGPANRLQCNFYTIRHDGSPDGFVRSWALQGSNDLCHWLDLRRHISDITLRLPGQYGSWPVAGPAAGAAYRAFRLLLLGPTSSTTGNPWAFCLSHWELYGYFHRLDGVAPIKPPEDQGDDVA